MKNLLVAMIIAVAALSGCATGLGLTDEQRLALYRAHAGESVGSFNYFRSLNGWTPLGDSALVVWTHPNEAYLLELMGTCPGLEFTPAISVTNQFSRVYAGFDEVVVLNDPAFNIPCRIDEIYPIDVEAVEQAEDELRAQVEMVERTQSEDGGT